MCPTYGSSSSGLPSPLPHPVPAVSQQLTVTYCPHLCPSAPPTFSYPSSYASLYTSPFPLHMAILSYLLCCQFPFSAPSLSFLRSLPFGSLSSSPAIVHDVNCPFSWTLLKPSFVVTFIPIPVNIVSNQSSLPLHLLQKLWTVPRDVGHGASKLLQIWLWQRSVPQGRIPTTHQKEGKENERSEQTLE